MRPVHALAAPSGARNTERVFVCLILAQTFLSRNVPGVPVASSLRDRGFVLSNLRTLNEKLGSKSWVTQEHNRHLQIGQGDLAVWWISR